MKRLVARWLAGSIVAVAALLGVVHSVPAAAQEYGSGVYGACPVNGKCPENTNTVTETKTGLQIAINLRDGQVIPLGTYTIIVTPLNGEGRSFQKAEFYLDGKLISTFTPDTTGTAAVAWDTTRDKGKTVKIIVYDTDGSTVTQEFTITISNIPGGGAVTLPGTSGDDSVVGSVVGFFQAVVKTIPVPIALSVPYLLLLGLLAIIIMLFLRSRRDNREAKRLQAAVERGKRLVEEKEGFIQLASHYLRTPLTLIKGGVDFLTTVQPAVSQEVIGGLTTSSNNFGNDIESLLNNISSDERLAAIKAATVVVAKPAWKTAMFWILLVAIGLFIIGFDALLASSGAAEMGVIIVLTQLSFFIALAIGLYVAVANRQSYRRDRTIAQQQQDQQIAIDEARNNLITQAATILAQKLESIRVFLPRIPEGQAKQFVLEGCDRISQTLKRFKATATVIPPITSMNFVPFRFSALLAQAQAAVAEIAQTKHISIVPTAVDDIALASQQPSWIVQILSSVIDNAVAYSPEGSQVEVDAEVKGGQAVLRVKDHGVGVPPEKVAELFQPFSKAEGAMQFDHPGLGLSLYLDRLLITNLNGEIHIDSQPGRGTAVTLSFPIQ